MTTLIVIPAYNEKQSLETIVSRAIQCGDICIVDDGSTDGSGEIAERLSRQYQNRVFCIRHQKNEHIAKSIQDGMKWAASRQYDWVISMDAGLSHDPDELAKFIDHSACDLLIGARERRWGVPPHRRLLSWVAVRVMAFLLERSSLAIFSPKITDCTSGFRRYSRRAFTEIAEAHLRSKAFDFHLEILFMAKSHGWSVAQIPISYRYTNSSLNLKTIYSAARFICAQTLSQGE